MDEIFSTALLHPRDRFDSWHEVACKRIIGHRSRALSRARFEATLHGALLADTELLVFQNSPMNVTRAQQDIARARCDDLFVCRQISGSLLLDQGGREARLAAGDFCLLDPLLPYTGKFFDGSELLLLKLDRRRLEARVGKTYGMTARPLGQGSIGRLTAGYLASLPGCVGEPKLAAAQLQEQALDLIALSLTSGPAQPGPSLSSSRAVALLKLRASIV
jgi:hypothetical protein